VSRVNGERGFRIFLLNPLTLLSHTLRLHIMGRRSAYSTPGATKGQTFAAVGKTGVITGITGYTGLQGTIGTIGVTHTATIGLGFGDLALLVYHASMHVAHHVNIGERGNGFFV